MLSFYSVEGVLSRCFWEIIQIVRFVPENAEYTELRNEVIVELARQSGQQKRCCIKEKSRVSEAAAGERELSFSPDAICAVCFARIMRSAGSSKVGS